ncbi:MAG: serine/threonine protein kinase [Planctomycetota bacterium]|nr:MAG: serine/threonine protein kinase [Planctomycetota bacterium]
MQERIGDYEVLAEVARGGMGAVYRARDPQLGRDVAIKVLRPAGRPTEHYRKRLLREAKALAKLNHPGVVAVHRVGEQDGQPYLVMDWVEGETLQARLEREGPFAPRLAAEVVRRLAETLHYAHGEGVLHRDLKPENVLVTTEGDLRITDFGLSKDLNASGSGTQLSLPGAYLGTPGFWPPEQALGRLEQVGPRSDVYALGATLYALLTGQPPYVAGCKNIPEVLRRMSEGPPRSPSVLRPGLDPRLEAICLGAMSPEPEQRPPSANALAEALEDYVRSGGGRPPAIEPAPPGADPFAKTAAVDAAPSAAGSGASVRAMGAAPSPRVSPSTLVLGLALLASLAWAVGLALRAGQAEEAASRARRDRDALEGRVVALTVERDDARRRVAEVELELDRLRAEAEPARFERIDSRTTAPAARGPAARVLAALPDALGPTERSAFARVLVALGADALPALRAALADPRPSVRAVACEAYGALAGAEARDLLLPLAEADPSPEVRAAARRALE